jgi:hypothetical protein
MWIRVRGCEIRNMEEFGYIHSLMRKDLKDYMFIGTPRDVPNAGKSNLQVFHPRLLLRGCFTRDNLSANFRYQFDQSLVA